MAPSPVFASVEFLFCVHLGATDFFESERALVTTSMDVFKSEPLPLADLLMANDDLRNHPFMDPAFVPKGTRNVPWPKCKVEFQALYEERRLIEEVDRANGGGTGIDWSFIPDFVRMRTDPSYWNMDAGFALMTDDG